MCILPKTVRNWGEQTVPGFLWFIQVKVPVISFLFYSSYTFERVQEDSDKVWKFQRYELIAEYHGRPLFFPPLIFISHILVFVRWIWQLCRCGNPPSGSSMSEYFLSGLGKYGILNTQAKRSSIFIQHLGWKNMFDSLAASLDFADWNGFPCSLMLINFSSSISRNKQMFDRSATSANKAHITDEQKPIKAWLSHNFSISRWQALFGLT